MDAARERELRELAKRLIASQRHRKIGLALGDLLAEIDLLRWSREPPVYPPLSPARQALLYEEAMAEQAKREAPSRA